MTIELGPYRLEIASDFGPRITSLRLGEGPEQFVSLGRDVVLSYPGGTFEFRGGHRLWAAPEDPGVTYASDAHDCAITQGDGVITVSAPQDDAGLVKEITVWAEDESLVVQHRLTSSSEHGMTAAAWAITQLPLGGTAIVPFEAEDTALSANRYLVLWPYTSIEDRRVSLWDEAVEIRALDGPHLKLGVGPSPGRLGYYQDGVVFIKEVESAVDREVPDFGAAGQVYIGEGFCELESVGGLTDLSDGGEAVLSERWSITECADLDAAIQLIVGG